MPNANDSTTRKGISEIPADIKKIIEVSEQKMCKANNNYQAYYCYLQSLWRVSNQILVKNDV